MSTHASSSAGSLLKRCSERLSGYFQELVSLIHDDRSRFQQLDADVKQLINGVHLGHIGGNSNAQLEGLLGIQDDAFSAAHHYRILESLRFDGIGRRYDSIEDHDQRTFRWIFAEDDDSDTNVDNQPSNDTSAESLRIKHEAREKFSTWLSSPTDIFHISRKLGSGKSTLMKFLYTSRHTRAQFKKWAGKKFVRLCFGPEVLTCLTGTRKPVFASFFFWKPGFEMQNSLNGLFRSLLHDILKACPELCPEVLHEHWGEAEQTPSQIQTELDIPSHTVERHWKRYFWTIK